MANTVSNWRGWVIRSCALLCAAGGSGLVATAALAETASQTRFAGQVSALTATQRSSSICAKVSPASVSRIVGFSVPAPTTDVSKLAATKQNDGISALVTTCTFGAQASLADLAKDVTLELEIASKPLTVSEVRQRLNASAHEGLTMKIASYSGLGVTGFFLTETGTGIHGEVIIGVEGTKSFSATVFTNLSTSKLASLARLAESL